MKRPLLAVGRRVRQRHVTNVLRRVNLPARVLDAGCGDGAVLAAMMQLWPTARFVGIDEEPDVLNLAQGRIGTRSGVSLKLGSVGGADLGEQFDLIVCVDVLEHIRNDRGAFRWLAEHLAPGGILLVHVPSSPQRHVLRPIDAAIQAEVQAGQGPHLREGYSAEGATSLLNAVGLKPTQLGFTFHHPVVRLAEDVDTLLYNRHWRMLKALLLPMLLVAASFERRPVEAGPAYGMLLTAATDV
jgi:SAM-dependent methyltransferase